jgi:hypothetical protein
MSHSSGSAPLFIGWETRLGNPIAGRLFRERGRPLSFFPPGRPRLFRDRAHSFLVLLLGVPDSSSLLEQ